MTVLFDGRKFGTPGKEVKVSTNVSTEPDLAPWEYVQFENPGNTGDFYKLVNNPSWLPPGRQACEVNMVSVPVGTSERISFRDTEMGKGVIPSWVGLQGHDLWYGHSELFPTGVMLTDFTHLLDIGGKFNTSASGNADHGGQNGAAVPELYLYNGKRAALPTDPAWTIRVKIVGATGSSPPPPTGWPASYRYYTIRTGAIPTDVRIDFLWHFKYSTVAGQALSEIWYRVAPSTVWIPGWTVADTGSNLVCPTPGDVWTDLHYNVYRNEGNAETQLVKHGGIYVATTRAEVEAAMWPAGTTPITPVVTVYQDGVAKGSVNVTLN